MHAIFYNADITATGVSNVQRMILAAHGRGRSDITLVLTSLGGDVTAGLGLFHFLRSLAFPVKLHAMGVCGSIAATIFMAGKQRTANDKTIFILHQPTYTEGVDKGKPTPRAQLISHPFREVANWDNEMIKFYFKERETSFYTADAVSLGVVQKQENLLLGCGDTFAVAKFEL